MYYNSAYAYGGDRFNASDNATNSFPMTKITTSYSKWSIGYNHLQVKKSSDGKTIYYYQFYNQSSYDPRPFDTGSYICLVAIL